MRALNILAMGAVASTLISCAEEVKITPAERLLNTIEKGIESGVVLFGHQDATVYGHSWKYEPNRSDVLEVVGDYPAVMGWDIGALELGKSENLDGVPFELMKSEIIKQHERGGINTISWHAYTPAGEDSWTKSNGIVTSILENGENNTIFVEWLGIVAEFFDSLKDSNGERIPIIFRPWHEHDGNWFWWGNNRCSAEEYVALWNTTYDYMTEYGLDNIVWSYMPKRHLEAKMPAPEKFDMVGFDTYQGKDEGAVEEYMAKMRDQIEMLKYYGEMYDKPIAITETGYEGIDMENWWTEVLLPTFEGEPISYVLMWRNAWDKPVHFYGPYKGHISEEDFKTFAGRDDIIFAKEAKELWK